MKRIIAALTALLIVASLFACRRGENDDDANTTRPTPSSTSESGSKTPSSVEDNMNMTSTYGRVTHKDGYTYFAVEGNKSDGFVNGVVDSDDIYRLKDGKTDPELIVSVPAYYDAESYSFTVYGIVPYGDYVYFLKTERNGTELCRAKAGGSVEKLETDLVFRPSRVFSLDAYKVVGDKLYLPYYDFEEGSGYMFKQVDLKTGKISDFNPDLGVGQNEITRIIRVAEDGYIYFVKMEDADSEPYGIFRTPMSGGKCEDVIPINDDFEEITFTQKYVFVVIEEDDYQLIGYDIKSGEKVGSAEIPRKAIVNICGDTVYYFLEHELFSVKIDGTERKSLVKGADTTDFIMIAVCGDRFFFGDDDMRMYVMDLDGRIIPRTPIVPGADRGEEKQSDDGFLYYEYDNTVSVSGYVGSSKNVEIPEKINGKPVRIVRFNGYNNKDIESIRVPEGVYSATVYSCRNVTQAYLPSTLKHMIYRGFPYSFEFADGCVINYNGTVAQWQEIVDFSGEQYYCAVDTYGTYGASVVCKDGVWHQPENY